MVIVRIKVKKLLLSLLVFTVTITTAQTSFTVGTNSVPVEFEDTTLSLTNRQTIASDLSIIFSYATSFDALKGEGVSGSSETFFLNTPTPPRLPFEGRPDIQIFHDANSQHISVGKAVSDAYLEAIALHDNHVDEFQKANAFLALLNNPQLLTQPVSILRGLHHVAPLTPTVDPPDAAIIAFATETQVFSYPGISLLDFSYIDIPQVSETPLLSFNLLFVQKTDSSTCMRFPVIYFAEKWGLGWTPY